MGQAGGAEKKLAFPNPHHLPATALRFEMQLDVAVDLQKKFFAGLTMKIEPLVRAMQDHYKKLVVMREDPTGPVGGIEVMPVFLDPGFEID